MKFWKEWAAQRAWEAEKRKLFELIMGAMAAYIYGDMECLKLFMNEAVIQYAKWSGFLK
jgi:hypothetical protein